MRKDSSPDKLNALADRLGDFNSRLVSIGDTGMSPEGQSNAIALLTVMRAGTFRDAETAFRALANTPPGGSTNEGSVAIVLPRNCRKKRPNLPQCRRWW